MRKAPHARESGTGGKKRTLAEKLQWLRELKTARGEKPPSYDVTARRITEATGVSISGPYFWELATGRTTNPKLHHLQALARFFDVPVGYLTDEHADFRKLESELRLLHSFKRGGLRAIRLAAAEGPEGDGEAGTDLPAIRALLTRLQLLDSFGDDSVRELALRLRKLSPRQREGLEIVMNDSELLDAVQDESTRNTAVRIGALAPAQRRAFASAIDCPEALESLREESVRTLAQRAAGLSEASRQVVLTMIEQLHRVEASVGSGQPKHTGKR